MRMHQVEVDDEVFSFVKTRAEPLIDTFNSALRRLLLPRGASRVGTAPHGPLADDAATPSFPTATPMALRHIVEVVRLVRGAGYTRNDATHVVAKRYGVSPQTVTDKFGRQLDLTVAQFDQLLEQEDLAELRTKLRSKFSDQTETIDHLLQ
jgi:negative regulator of replication initiation